MKLTRGKVLDIKHLFSIHIIVIFLEHCVLEPCNKFCGFIEIRVES